jgi:RsiW-degrading membrane proteinase PrsW (M82 family)
MADRDPIERVLGHSVDLYDVAEWDPRTSLDRIAVALHGWVQASGHQLLIVIAILLFVGQLGLAALILVQEPVLGVLSMLSVVPALAIVGYFWWGDPTRREPLDNLAITFVLAVVFASFALVVNSAFRIAFAVVPVVGMALYFFLVVGPVEEVVKLLAVRSYAFETENFDAVIDGAVYGAVAGLGFATIENVVYIIQGYVQTMSTTGGMGFDGALATATSRAFVGPGHVLYSAIAGYYLGLAKFNDENYGPIVVKGLLLAVLLHATYNTTVSYLPAITGGNLLAFLGFVLVFDGALAYFLYRKLSRYREYYDRVGDPATTADAEALGEE